MSSSKLHHHWQLAAHIIWVKSHPYEEDNQEYPAGNAEHHPWYAGLDISLHMSNGSNIEQGTTLLVKVGQDSRDG